MSDPNKIREAVKFYVPEYLASSSIRLLVDAALAYADSLEDPIWWCFEHQCPIWFDVIGDGHAVCDWADKPLHREPCDIAKATRPRRIDEAPESQLTRHVCGLQGFGLGDTCEACERGIQSHRRIE